MPSIDVYKRFLNGNPEAQREYRTVEAFHPQWDRSYRFVKNYTDREFTLESTAPRNAGEIVTFDGVTLNITEPAEREDSEQILSITFGNVDGLVYDMLDQISGAGYLSQVEIVYRKYYSGDTTEPASTPLYLYLSGVDFEGPTSVSMTAEDVDMTQKRAGIVYTTKAFPGLAP